MFAKVFFRYVACAFVCLTAMCGCENMCDEAVDDGIESKSNYSVEQFCENYRVAYPKFGSSSIIIPQDMNYSRSNGHDVTVVYVNVSDAGEDCDLTEVKTTEDFIRLKNEFNIDYSFVRDCEKYPDSIIVDNEAIEAGFIPLIAESKNYLYGKGITEDQIQEMLIENETDEKTLVPVALALMEYEFKGGAEYFDVDSSMYLDSRSIDWVKVGGCAMAAIGLDILKDLSKFGKNVTWEIVKKVFKTTAKRIAGPFGVACAVVEFTLCYF